MDEWMCELVMSWGECAYLTGASHPTTCQPGPGVGLMGGLAQRLDGRETG